MKNRLHNALSRVTAALAGCGASYALVGGIAVSVRAEPRLTRDLDLAVATSTDRDAESLVRSLVARGYEVQAVVEEDRVARMATARLANVEEGGHGVVVDLLFASSGIESELVGGAEMIEVFSGLRVPVAGVGDLIALKLLARDDRSRPQDADDLRALGSVATLSDIQRARNAAALVAARGFAWQRDLAATFELWLNEAQGALVL